VLHQQVIPDTGTNQIHNTLARYISDKFIQQHRYDPLHNSKGEQALHNNLNKWINALGQRQKLLVTVDSDGGELSISLQRDEIIQLLTQRLSALKTALKHKALCLIFFFFFFSLILSIDCLVFISLSSFFSLFKLFSTLFELFSTFFTSIAFFCVIFFTFPFLYSPYFLTPYRFYRD
jgi:hypothetical protein